MYKKGIALSVLFLAASKAGTAPPDSPDKVASLWQMPDLSFGLYSGMLPISGTSKSLHYVAALSK
jgi:hypothetical protein